MFKQFAALLGERIEEIGGQRIMTEGREVTHRRDYSEDEGRRSCQYCSGPEVERDPEIQASPEGMGLVSFCCTSDRGTGILFSLPGHRGSPALVPAICCAVADFGRETNNELTSVEARHAGGPALCLVSTRVESPITRGNLPQISLFSSKGGLHGAEFNGNQDILWFFCCP